HQFLGTWEPGDVTDLPEDGRPKRGANALDAQELLTFWDRTQEPRQVLVDQGNLRFEQFDVVEETAKLNLAGISEEGHAKGLLSGALDLACLLLTELPPTG